MPKKNAIFVEYTPGKIISVQLFVDVPQYFVAQNLRYVFEVFDEIFDHQTV
jgi:hypothetical protein